MAELSALHTRILDFRHAVMNRDGAKIADMLQDLKHRIEQTDGAAEARVAAVQIAAASNVPAAYESRDRKQTAAEEHRQAGLEVQHGDLKFGLSPALAGMESAPPADSRAERLAMIERQQDAQALSRDQSQDRPKGPKR